jgi:hypothetical protein
VNVWQDAHLTADPGQCRSLLEHGGACDVVRWRCRVWCRVVVASTLLLSAVFPRIDQEDCGATPQSMAFTSRSYSNSARTWEHPHSKYRTTERSSLCVWQCRGARTRMHTKGAPARTVTRTARFFLPDVDPIRAHFTSSHFHSHNRTMMSPWMVVVVAVLMAVTPSDAQFTKRNRTMATRACRPEFASMPWCDTTKTVSD